MPTQPMPDDRPVSSWVCQIVDSERKALDAPKSCFKANYAGSSNENNGRGEPMEIANGCFASKIMISKAKELNRK